MQLKTFRVDGTTFIASPYRPGISIREDVFKSQFQVQCDGRFEYPEDERVWGTYHLQGSLDLGECGLIEEAMSLAETCVKQHRFDLSGREDLISFSPELITIHDDQDRLVLVGQAHIRDVRWCVPVSSSAEADEVASRVAKLNSEASFERGWDNFETARLLNRNARVLQGRLVHPIWRDHAKAAIANLAAIAA